MIVMVLSQFIPYVGGLLVSGPLTIGYFLIIGDAVKDKKFNAGRLFQGFEWLVPAFLAYVVISIFTTIGFILLIIPGLVVGGWYMLTYIYIVDKKLDFWEAMEASRITASRDTVGMTIFYLVLGVIIMSGILIFFTPMIVIAVTAPEAADAGGVITVFALLGFLAGLGTIFVTLPLTMIAIFVAYERLEGMDHFFDAGKSDQPSPTPEPPKIE